MSHNTPPTPSIAPLPGDMLLLAQKLLAEKGPNAAADRLGVSVAALLRGCAGAAIRRGTINSMRLAMKQR